MTPAPLPQEHRASMTRRALFGRGAAGLGAMALGTLLERNGFALAPDKAAPALPHFAPKAKRVIYLFQNGAPTHVDLFDYKPKLKEWHGQQIPDEVVGGRRFSTMTGGQTARPVLGNITKFAQHGQSGAWVSDFLPHTAAIADDLCFIKSMHTDAVNHAPAITFFLTGGEHAGPAEHGRVADLRPRQRDRGPAGLRRDDLARQGGVLRADLLRLLLGQRLPAVEVSGREVPRQRRSGALSLATPTA